MPVIVLDSLDHVSMVTLRERNGELAPSQMSGKGFFHLNRDGISRIQCERACIDSGNFAVRLHTEFGDQPVLSGLAVRNIHIDIFAAAQQESTAAVIPAQSSKAVRISSGAERLPLSQICVFSGTISLPV